MESLTSKWLAPRLRRFHRAWPDIRLGVLTGDEYIDFVREGFDVGIRHRTVAGGSPYVARTARAVGVDLAEDRRRRIKRFNPR